MRKKLKKLVLYNNCPTLTVYLLSWFPLWSQGLYLFGVAWVKYVYYKDTDRVCWYETDNVIKHEYGHYVSRLNRGFINFWGNIIWDYIRFWIPHNLKLMEIEANDIKLGLK